MSLISTKPEIICRICLLGTQDKYFSLFEQFKDYSPAYHINSITNLQINDEDTLPDRICTICLLDLENAINFKIKCESSDAFLKKTLDDINSETNLPKLQLTDCDKVSVKEEDPDYEEDYLDNDICDEVECNFKPSVNKNEWSNLSDDDISVKVDVPAKCPVICHDCGGVFKSKCKLRVHWKKEHKIYLDCDLCKARFCTMKALKNHKLSNSERCKKLNSVTIDGFGKNRLFSCRVCSYSSKSTNGILQHQLVHSGERRYNCHICKKTFVTPAPCYRHMENVHKMYKKVLTCEVCGLKLFGQSNFYSHMKKHNPKYYECDLCHKKLKTKCNIINHLNRHAGVKNFCCEFCPKVVTSSAELANHKRAIHLKIPYTKKYKECPICKYKTYTNSSMKSHQENHTGDNVACEVCGKFFDSDLYLWVHKMCHMPNTVERRTCPFCSKLCETAAATRKHMVVHLNKKVKNYNADQVVSRMQYVWSEQKPDITMIKVKRKKKETKKTLTAPFPANIPKVKNKAKNIANIFKSRSNLRISANVPKA